MRCGRCARTHMFGISETTTVTTNKAQHSVLLVGKTHIVRQHTPSQ